MTAKQFAEKYRDCWVRCTEGDYSFEGKVCGYTEGENVNDLVLVSHIATRTPLLHDIILSESDSGGYWYAFINELKVLDYGKQINPR